MQVAVVPSQDRPSHSFITLIIGLRTLSTSLKGRLRVSPPPPLRAQGRDLGRHTHTTRSGRPPSAVATPGPPSTVMRRAGTTPPSQRGATRHPPPRHRPRRAGPRSHSPRRRRPSTPRRRRARAPRPRGRPHAHGPPPVSRAWAVGSTAAPCRRPRMGAAPTYRRQGPTHRRSPGRRAPRSTAGLRLVAPPTGDAPPERAGFTREEDVVPSVYIGHLDVIMTAPSPEQAGATGHTADPRATALGARDDDMARGLESRRYLRRV